MSNKNLHPTLDQERYTEPTDSINVKGLPNTVPGSNNPSPFAQKLVRGLVFVVFPFIIVALTLMLFDFIRIF